MSILLIVAIVVIIIAVFFDFTNGFNDSANQVATVIVSRAMRPGVAFAIAAAFNFIGAYFLGTAVAETIGKGIVDPAILQDGISGIMIIGSALIGAIFWNLITWYFGIPSSSSHALIGGLLGAFLFGWGPGPIHWTRVIYVVAVMVVSPMVGFVATYIFTRLTMIFSQWFTPRASKIFSKLQYLSLIGQSLSHGTNDAQKTMGIITFTLIITGLYAPVAGNMFVPQWVILLCSSAMALGTIIGGQRIIKKLGVGLYKVRPIHSLVSQTASASIIFIASLFGFPLSTTQVISSSVMGAGSAFRPKMIRWQVVQEMIMVWLVTIPTAGLMAGITYLTLANIYKILI